MPCTGVTLVTTGSGLKQFYILKSQHFILILSRPVNINMIINHVNMPTKFYYVYILRSLKDRLFYIGFTEDLKQRIIDHNKGKNISTKNRRPLELIFYEAFTNKLDALRRESYFKTNKGKTSIKVMLKEFLN